jgi:predicted RecA/RadA family phage recombinase
MKNFVQPGETISLASPAAVISGAGLLVGSLFGVASGNAAIGETVDLVTRGVFTLPKVSAQAQTLGAKLYWDDAAKLVTTVSAGNTLIGVAVEVAPNPSPTATVRLNGSF